MIQGIHIESFKEETDKTTLDELIESLLKAKEKLGGEILARVGDSEGYTPENLRCVELFIEDNVLVLSAQ
jgi:hypothetical protein